MKKQLLSLRTATLFVALLLTNCSFAQPSFDWAKALVTHDAFGNFYTGLTTQQAVDSDGNIYTTGYFSGISDFDPGPDTFELNATAPITIFILKLDRDGNFLWAKTLEGDKQVAGNYVVGVPITIDLNGNLLITGFFIGNIDFDPGPTVYNITSSGARSDIFVLKLDQHGNFLWARTMGSGKFGLFGASAGDIAVDDSGSIYVTGSFADTVDFGAGLGTLTAVGFYDVFVLKLYANGAFVWVKQFGGSNCQNSGFSIRVGASGSIYLSGVFTETVDFDPGVGVHNIPAKLGYDTYICKLNADGSLIWVKSLGGEKSIFGYALALNADEDVIIAGMFQTTVDFDPGPGSHLLGPGSVYILKLSKDGNFKWAKNLGAEPTRYAVVVLI